jgi:hypothetical protein
MVTPSLRSVWVSWDAHRIDAEFTYDTEHGDTADLVAEIETQVLADFDDQTVTKFEVQVVPGASSRGAGETAAYVYLRRER